MANTWRAAAVGRAFEITLWAAGIVCCLGYAASAADIHESHAIAAAVGTGTNRPPRGVLGRLEIPELQISVPVLDNYDSTSLLHGVGHVPGTATPGGLGNLVLAGHRDTYFRSLRRITPGMLVRVVTEEGTWKYRVVRFEVVQPEQVEILEIGDHPEMTLITCYPFDFIGAAPKRFIVHADLLSTDAR